MIIDLISHNGFLYQSGVEQTSKKHICKIKLNKYRLSNKFTFAEKYSIKSNSFIIDHGCSLYEAFLREVDGELYIIVLAVFGDRETIRSAHIFKAGDEISLSTVINLSEIAQIKYQTANEKEHNVKVKHLIEFISSSTLLIITNSCCLFYNLKTNHYQIEQHSLESVKDVCISKPIGLKRGNVVFFALIVSCDNIVIALRLQRAKSNFQVNVIKDCRFIFPAMYAPITISMFLQQSQDIENMELQNEKSHINEIFNTLYITTSRKQFVAIKNGKVCFCVPIPFHDAEKILVFSNGFGAEYFIIVSRGKKIYVLDDEYKEIVSLHNIDYCLVDDFVINGSLQMLACKVDLNGCIVNKLLTDFATCHFDATKSEFVNTSNDDQDEVKGLQMVTRALETKLQQSINDFYAKQQQCRQADLLIAEACKSFQFLHMGQPQISNSSMLPPLIPIIGDKSGNKLILTEELSLKMPVENKDKSVIIPGEIWQRIIEDKWIVAISVLNKTNRELFNPELFMIPMNSKQYELESKSMIYHFQKNGNGDNFCAEPLLKRQRVDDISLTGQYDKSHINAHESVEVIVVTKLPNFYTSHSLQYGLSLSWTIKQAEVASHNMIRAHQAQSLGVVGISSNDVLSEKYRCNMLLNTLKLEQLHDLIALDVCQYKMEVTFKSIFSSLEKHLETVLCKIMTFLPTPYSYGSSNQYIGTRGPTEYSRIQILAVGSKTANTNIYCTNEKQFLLLIHLLYEHLPDDVIILSANHNEENKLLNDILKSMLEEITMTEDSLCELIKNTEEMHQSKDTTETDTLALETVKSQEDVIKARSAFKAVQESMKAKTSNLVDHYKLLQCRKQKALLERKTDETVAKLGNV